MKRTILLTLALTISMVTTAQGKPAVFSGKEYFQAKALLVKSMQKALHEKNINNR